MAPAKAKVMHHRSSRFMKPKYSFNTVAMVAAAIVAGASSAWAHPGHEHPVTPPGSPLHWFLEPEHLLNWAGMAAVIVIFYKTRRYWLPQPAKETPVPASEGHSH
ncbi:MAG: hypothetical protein JWO94_184, partial [Verrucomicrobiaceae bacterium]|nr:hypothetical protein [Verrucomicrobiaceae bacterium]